MFENGLLGLVIEAAVAAVVVKGFGVIEGGTTSVALGREHRPGRQRLGFDCGDKAATVALSQQYPARSCPGRGRFSRIYAEGFGSCIDNLPRSE